MSELEKLFKQYAIQSKDYWDKQDIAIYNGSSVRVVDDIVKKPGFPVYGIKPGTIAKKVWDRKKVCDFLKKMAKVS